MVVAHRGGASHEGFSIGEAAAMVGVSTHVIRSWERRLSLGLNHRTQTNQRRYRMEDVQRFVAIKRLHETSGLPLVEAAAKALTGTTPSRVWDDAAPSEAISLEHLWASLIETLPELLIVVDDGGHIVAANSMARNALNVKTGASLSTLAPPGWQITYRALRRGQLGHGDPILLAMRGKSGVIFADVHFVPLGRTPDGAAVIVGTPHRGALPSMTATGPIH
jgi:DNA-binding transcriptional MerR regulator